MGTWLLVALVACSDPSELVEEALAPPPPREGPGVLHVDFPVVPLEAKPGQRVLAPTQEAVERALRERDGAIVFYGGTLRSVDEAEASVRGEAGTSTVPNAAIIELPAEVEVVAGEVVLGAWDHGSGLHRALVLEGGTAPRVRYLDRREQVATWVKGSFRAVRQPFDPGSAVACGTGRRRHALVVRRQGERLLLSGFASKLIAADVADCDAVPIHPEVEKGEVVWVPKIGRYVQGEVVAVDEGRVSVRTTWGGRSTVDAYPMLDVAKGWPSHEAGAPTVP